MKNDPSHMDDYHQVPRCVQRVCVCVCVSESLCVGAEALCYIMLLQPTHRLTKSSVYNGIIWPKIHK